MREYVVIVLDVTADELCVKFMASDCHLTSPGDHKRSGFRLRLPIEEETWFREELDLVDRRGESIDRHGSPP